MTAYKEHGIAIDMVTAQNEPTNAPCAWESCAFDPALQAQFVGSYLGPRLATDHPEVDILMLDDNKSLLPEWTDAVFGDPQASKYLAGVGVHWYTGDWFDNVVRRCSGPRAHVWHSVRHHASRGSNELRCACSPGCHQGQVSGQACDRHRSVHGARHCAGPVESRRTVYVRAPAQPEANVRKRTLTCAPPPRAHVAMPAQMGTTSLGTWQTERLGTL